MHNIHSKFNQISESGAASEAEAEFQALVTSIEEEIGHQLGVDYRTDEEVKMLEKQGLIALQALANS